MDLRKVKKLIELLEESGLSEIEITEGDDKVKITKGGKQAPQANVVETAHEPEALAPTETIEEDSGIKNNNGFHEIKAPMIGTFYQSSEPDAEAFVKIGDPISEGDTLCIIEAMKMMNKIDSDVSGTIERVLVQNGDPVEFDQILFLVSKK
ncbi:MAG: acetyl-CoA carboxylase biotin carboxyl carrier protein [Gammaproteobacteria bacterium]|jgi:acetyl-CoA carboxylase biotin carboxyl carrier protein|nr:acetyl-CoA carboxylase biotin carboxyl carrier protein [Gammaproteobacteria bacterium]HJM08491.1 acetyl-CoA carboxylase biotin carboxyl carrier protein [Gammaproteobacteria bacterium]HJN00221.1 acetyl-CoA carboxylase biotin carboxyl carrier protein [Gammaproteobacteria bacterium]|tara:strand:- start:6565 stop:7017 length:453 start_codon:yes stop_codon:yes gene_type:complete